MTGCSIRQSMDKIPAKSDAKIYDSLIAANEKYGSGKEQICKSNFKCDPSEISENVVIAPTWEPDIFKNHADDIKHIAGPTGHGYDIYEISANNGKSLILQQE